jgi:hypothetical protein
VMPMPQTRRDALSSRSSSLISGLGSLLETLDVGDGNLKVVFAASFCNFMTGLVAHRTGQKTIKNP